MRLKDADLSTIRFEGAQSNRCWHLRRRLITLIGLLSLVYSGTANAQSPDSLWQDLTAAELAAIPAKLLVTRVSYQRGIGMARSTLDTVDVDGTFTIETSPGNQTELTLISINSYPNGDISWRARNDLDSRDTLVLTRSGGDLLATANVAGIKYRIVAQLDVENDRYVGWITNTVEEPQQKSIDDGGFIPPPEKVYSEPQAVIALSGNDVTVTQTLSKDYAVIGEQVTNTITITNNTSNTLTNEAVTIFFVLDKTNFIGSTSGCVVDSSGSQKILSCTISSLAPAANTSIEYTVQITSASYPQTSNSVFVGNAFGENVRSDSFIFVAQDTLTDSDNDGISDFNEGLLGTSANSSASTIGSDQILETDLMFYYSQRFLDAIGSVKPETQINQLTEIANGYYADSGALVRFRPVFYGSVDFDPQGNLNTVMNAMRDGTGPFSDLSAIRDKVGADIVVFVDGLFPGSGACGLGTLPGVRFEGEVFHPLVSGNGLFSSLYNPGFPAGGGSGCDDLTLAHELGHNHGLAHSRREESARGTYEWSFGHGVDGSFATIMANPGDYPGSEELALFSNPNSTNCKGLTCGVARSDSEQGADAVFTINQTRVQISKRREPKILPITKLGSGSSNLILYGAASRSSDLNTPVSSFSSTDSIDVRANLFIPSEHQSLTGVTYVVISVEGTGLFYRDAAGAYQTWNGDVASLKGNINPRPLNVSEELVAFSDFVPANFGVSSANLTVFFAYAISGTDVFVYSSNGISFSIQ